VKDSVILLLTPQLVHDAIAAAHLPDASVYPDDALVAHCHLLAIAKVHCRRSLKLIAHSHRARPQLLTPTSSTAHRHTTPSSTPYILTTFPLPYSLFQSDSRSAMSPRRSSRARTTQPPPSVATAHSTSSSSVSSARTDRAGRSANKQATPPKSLSPHSLSEEPEEPPRDAHAEPPLTRRRTREQDNDDEPEDDMAEEDEVTRCVCGFQDYPGLSSDAAKSSAALPDTEAPSDDLGGLFIQCDICKVWQHGGCVGIMQEEASPDEYFCEECRKDLHKVMTSPKG
jgi:hypothetical protein